MALVDPGDDDIERFIVRHYRHDPQRRERRHVVVAAFDNKPEFRARMDSVRDEIKARRDRGEPGEPGDQARGDRVMDRGAGAALEHVGRAGGAPVTRYPVRTTW